MKTWMEVKSAAVNGDMDGSDVGKAFRLSDF
jgi:hypothetical protein